MPIVPIFDKIIPDTVASVSEVDRSIFMPPTAPISAGERLEPIAPLHPGPGLEPLPAPHSPGPGKWSAGWSAGPSTNLRSWANGVWTRGQVRYSPGPRWYLWTGLDYQYTAMHLAVDEEQARLAEERLNESGQFAGQEPNAHFPADAVQEQWTHRIGIPAGAGFRPHPNWRLEAAVQLNVLAGIGSGGWSSQAFQDETFTADPWTEQQLAVIRDFQFEPAEVRRLEPTLEMGVHWQFRPKLSLYGAWQQGLTDVAEQEHIRSVHHALRAGVQVSF